MALKSLKTWPVIEPAFGDASAGRVGKMAVARLAAPDAITN